MEKRTKLIAAAVVAVAIVATVGVAVANKHHNRWENAHIRWKAGMVADWLERKVDLTQEQHERVVALGEQFRARIEANREAVIDSFAAAIRSPSLDKQQAAELIETRRSGREAMQGAMAETLVDLHAILTPEQRDKLAKYLAEHGMPGYGRGHGHRDGKHGDSPVY